MKKASILFVDDEKGLVTTGKLILESIGYKVTPSTSGIEAFTYFQESPQDFDLIITDYKMPDMNGGELAVKIKLIRPDVPIILSTGCRHLSHETVRMCGIDEMIFKPCDPGEMLNLIEKVLK